jgi:hypothetical protein
MMNKGPPAYYIPDKDIIRSFIQLKTYYGMVKSRYLIGVLGGNDEDAWMGSYAKYQTQIFCKNYAKRLCR